MHKVVTRHISLRAHSFALQLTPGRLNPVRSMTVMAISQATNADARATVLKLEQEADDLHKQAQRANKDGRFDDAKKAYAAMHAAEDAASCLARVAGTLSAGSSGKGSTDEGYSCLHRAGKWPAASLGSGVCSEEYKDRLLGCIVGSLVADAAAMGVHWVYDMDKLKELDEKAKADNKTSLAFQEPPQSPFYSYASGRNSPYGEQTLALLESMACRGGLDCKHYAANFQRIFGAADFDGYLDVSAKGFLRNFGAGDQPPASGANDSQANCTARLGPLIAAYAADERLLPCVQRATRVTQNADAAAAWGGVGAAILEAIVLGAPPSAAVEATIQELDKGTGRLEYTGELGKEIAGHLRRVIEMVPEPPAQACSAFGRNCHMAAALQTPLHVVLHIEYLACKAPATGNANSTTSAGAATSSSHAVTQGAITTDNVQQAGRGSLGGSVPGSLPEPGPSPLHLSRKWYRTGIELAIREGGCSASRASYAGACLGAVAGLGGIEPSWEAKYPQYQHVLQCARAIVNARL